MTETKTKTRQRKLEFWMFLSQEFQPSIVVLKHVRKIYLHELSFHWFTVMFYLQCQMPNAYPSTYISRVLLINLFKINSSSGLVCLNKLIRKNRGIYNACY